MEDEGKNDGNGKSKGRGRAMAQARECDVGATARAKATTLPGFVFPTLAATARRRWGPEFVVGQG